MTNFFVIILNFNNQKDIIPCLKSLIKFYPKINIIIVDNASTDNSLQSIISLKYERLKIIKNQKNLGFARAVNKGIKLALKQGAEAILLLNPDTIVKPFFLEPLLSNPAEIVGPIISFKRKEKLVYDLGGKVNFWLGRTYHLETDHLETKKLKAGKKNKIDYVSGCAMLIKRPVFEKIGLLNERFFLYFEDVDFCLRAKKAGFNVALEPKSMIFHQLSEGKEKPFFCQYHLLLSNLIFINIWVPFFRRPIAYLYFFFLSLKMILNRF
jgi:GT2 family glycosyltransferase